MRDIAPQKDLNANLLEANAVIVVDFIAVLLH